MEAKKLNPTPELQLVAGTKHEGYILHPVLDVLMVGGLGIIFFLGMHFFVPISSDTNKLGWLMFYASFVINYPHFMASYIHMYKDYRKEIFTNWKFTWAGVVAPILLISALLGLSYYAKAQNNNLIFGHMASLMFFLVGHHYVKQIYGCVMVSSAKKKFYFSKWESRALWFSMYSIWGISFFNSNIHAVYQHNFYGVTYQTLGLNPIWLKVAEYSTYASLLTFLGLMTKRFIDDGKVMPLTAWTALLTIYLWYIPAFQHAHYFYMIPFFHSLQYLLFSLAFAKNKAKDEAGNFNDGPKHRAAFLKKFASFLLMAAITGYLAWDYIPKFLDAKFPAAAILGPTAFMFSIQIFLNVHHYLIDNVLWRKDNSLMKKYL